MVKVCVLAHIAKGQSCSAATLSRQRLYEISTSCFVSVFVYRYMKLEHCMNHPGAFLNSCIVHEHVNMEVYKFSED